ncbi:MAG TPA: hypothetical protein VML36_00510, partial [Nitrospiria bacterium]|nr:hypothetical protein [Nitrospiria bacterium]
VSFLKALLIAWWDAGRAVWLYWVGLFRVLFVAVGWLLTLVRLMFKLLAEIGRQLILAPFTLTGKMTKSYFQPGVPWVAFLLLLFWGALEAIIFTYTLYPTVSEVLADLVGVEVSPYAGSFLFLFLLVLILGSFACIQALMEAIRQRQYKFLVQMVLVELFVMFFEVMFLYRELVDAITPWIAQQTGGQFRMGLWSTLTFATFGWIGIRGMTWFLFGQFGTAPLLAFISRRPLQQAEEQQAAVLSAEQVNWWRTPVQDFKREVTWLHQKSDEFLDYLCLPVLHVLAAVINFAMILVAASPAFSLPFKSLKEVMETRELLSGVHMHAKKVEL